MQRLQVICITHETSLLYDMKMSGDTAKQSKASGVSLKRNMGHVWFVTSIFAYSLLLFCILLIIGRINWLLYCCANGLFLVFMLVFWLFCSYPVIYKTQIEIKWHFYPFFRLSFNYKDVDKVIVKRDLTYLIVSRISHIGGKSVFRGPLGCMGVTSLKRCLLELRRHGVVVDNRLHFKDIT